MSLDTSPALKERIDRALRVAHDFGGTDGSYHKMWIIDQMVRALTGCRLVDDFLEPSDEYLRWVEERKAGEDGPETYDWDTGIAP